MGKDVTIHFDGNVISKAVRVDDQVLTFVGTKAVAKDVRPGLHFLQWFGEAVPGTPYEIGIDSPPEAQWGPKSSKANPGGLFGGSKIFKVNQT